MKKIEIKGMKFFAHHGWYEIERKMGQNFTIDFMCEIIQTNKVDDLNSTIDYQEIYNYINGKMKNPCKLLETLIDIIGEGLISQYPIIQSATIKIHKQPSLGGVIQEVSLTSTYVTK